MISDILSVVKFLDEHLEKGSIFSAMFDWQGNRKSGSEIVKVKTHPLPDRDDTWFYEVEEYKDYVFIPFPVIPSVYFDYGIVRNSKNADARFFRFVSSPMSKYSVGGEANLRVDFMVFGYKPTDLMDLKKVDR